MTATTEPGPVVVSCAHDAVYSESIPKKFEEESGIPEQTELALSLSTARQIPLGPVDELQLSGEVRQLKEWAADGYDLNHLADAHREYMACLKTEYLE